MRVDSVLRAELLAAIPQLRAFARSLVHNRVDADDLVQDTLVRAWGNMHTFLPGTNFEAWLFTILRNRFYSCHRTKKREVEDVDGIYAGRVAQAPEQDSHLDFKNLQTALGRLCPEQREAILLVVPQGFSYEEAARICGVSLGTVKSRVARGRQKLARLLSMDHLQDLGPDRVTRAVLGAQLHVM
jgi:RNA polymerase sigma-70 factor (ECF subfamily)